MECRGREVGQIGPCEGRLCGREEYPQAGMWNGEMYLCRECGGQPAPTGATTTTTTTQTASTGAAEPVAAAPARPIVAYEPAPTQDEEDSLAFGRECAARGMAQRAFASDTRATAARINAQPADPTKAEAMINGALRALYLVTGADGRQRWISEPVSPEPTIRGAVPCAPAGMSTYRVALADAEGHAVPLGTISARAQRHAHNRAAKLGARIF